MNPTRSSRDDAERSDDPPLLREAVLPPLPLLEDPPLRGEAVPLLLEPPRDRCSLARVGGDGCAHGVAAFEDPDDGAVQPLPPPFMDPPLEPASPELDPAAATRSAAAGPAAAGAARHSRAAAVAARNRAPGRVAVRRAILSEGRAREGQARHRDGDGNVQ